MPAPAVTSVPLRPLPARCREQRWLGRYVGPAGSSRTCRVSLMTCRVVTMHLRPDLRFLNVPNDAVRPGGPCAKPNDLQAGQSWLHRQDLENHRYQVPTAVWVGSSEIERAEVPSHRAHCGSVRGQGPRPPEPLDQRMQRAVVVARDRSSSPHAGFTPSTGSSPISAALISCSTSGRWPSSRRATPRARVLFLPRLASRRPVGTCKALGCPRRPLAAPGCARRPWR